MNKKVSGLACAMLAITALALAASVTSAAEFAVSPAGTDTLTSEGKLSFSNSSWTISCNITLATSLLAGPIEKVEGRKIGEVNSVTWLNCEGTNIRAVLAIPWEIQYESITGTLPEAVSTVDLTIKNIGFQLALFFGLVNCLYGGDVKVILTLNHRTGVSYTSGSIRVDETVTQSLRSGPEGCPSTGSIRGRFELSSVQTLTRS